MIKNNRLRGVATTTAFLLTVGAVAPLAAAADGSHQTPSESGGQTDVELGEVPEHETQPTGALERKGDNATDNNPDGGASTQQAVGTGSPHDCWGKTNCPHKSTSSDTYGDVKGFAETWCNLGATEYVWVSASLWEQRWWGYSRLTDWAANDSFWDDYEGVSAHYDGCLNNTWRLSGYHEVTDYGVDYSGSTAEYAPITC